MSRPTKVGQEADDPLGDLLAFLLLQEVTRAGDRLGGAGAGNARRHALGGDAA